METKPEDGKGRAPGAPWATGWVLAAVAGLVAVVIFAASRQPPVPGGGSTAVVQPSGPVGAPDSPPTGGVPGEQAPTAGPAPPNPPATTERAPAAPQGGVARGTMTPPKAEVMPEDLPPDHPPVSAAPESQTSIQWLGHSCFYIHSPGGVAVVTDPFDPARTGLEPPNTGAHLVTVSAEAPAHNNVEAVHAFQGEKRQVLRGASAQRGDTRVTPVPIYRDRSGGGREGRGFAYVIESGTLRIAHLGDLGGPLNAAQLEALGPVDILMLPAGGDGLSPKEAVEVAKQVNPKIVLPMAVSTSGMEGAAARLRSLDEFISASPWAVTRKDTDIMLISKAELPASTEIYSLKYGR